MKAELEKLSKSTSVKTRTFGISGMEQEFVTEVGPVLNLKSKISSDKKKQRCWFIWRQISFLIFQKRDFVNLSRSCRDRGLQRAKALDVLDHSAENRGLFHAMDDRLMISLEKTGKKRPIHNCIEAYRFVVGITPPEEPQFIPFACDTGLPYLARYELTRNVKDLHRVFKYTGNCICFRTDGSGYQPIQSDILS